MASEAVICRAAAVAVGVASEVGGEDSTAAMRAGAADAAVPAWVVEAVAVEAVGVEVVAAVAAVGAEGGVDERHTLRQ